jgi:hypothetical protein
VQKIVGDLIKPTLVHMGVDESWGLRRLIETIDSDITEFAGPKGGFMSLQEIQELPLEKRRLIKKYKETFDQYGGLKSREVELEPKQPAMELFAKMRGWVRDEQQVLVDGDALLRLMDQAAAVAETRTAQVRAAAAQSRTAQQFSRPAMLQRDPVTIEALPSPVAPEKPSGT